MKLDLLKLYREFLIPLTPTQEVSDILKVVMQGGETTHDFGEIIRNDPELKEWVEITVQRSGRINTKAGIDHAVSMLGLNRIRNMIVGRSIERAAIAPDKSLLAKLTEEHKKTLSKSSANTKPKRKSEEATEEAENKLIPDILEFEQYTLYAKRAEAAAIEIKNSYTGQAYAGGVLFDYINTMISQKDFSALVKDHKFKKPQKFVEEVFDDGLRCALAAEEITKFLQIHYQRNVFFTALVRNIGKILLLAYDPISYEKTVLAHQASKKAGIPMRHSDSEEDVFDFDHAQISALYVGHVPSLEGLEKSIDYHHNPRLLKSRDQDLYALSCVMRVAALLNIVYQETRSQEPDIQKIQDHGVIQSVAFKFLRITQSEWEQIKSNYALNLLKIGL